MITNANAQSSELGVRGHGLTFFGLHGPDSVELDTEWSSFEAESVREG